MTQFIQHYENPQDVYARHLSSRRGYPLWMPELKTQLPKDYQDYGLKIGDVGYVVPEEGCFEVLFNICLPFDHDLHRNKPLPRNFQPITLDEADVATYIGEEAAGKVIKSTSVSTIDVSPEGQPSDYRFTFSSNEGALLILPQGADRHSLRRLRVFGRYAKQHAVEWYRFVEEDLEQIISNDSLYLITGFHKARSWALTAFEEAEGPGTTPARFKVTQTEGGAVVRGYNWNTTRHSENRIGPEIYNGNANQAVYIRGFKITVRDEPVGWKQIVVKADHPSVKPPCEEFTDTVDSQQPDEPENSGSNKIHAKTDSSSTDRGTQRVIRHVSLQHVPQGSKIFHPSDIINRYLLRREPSAAVAITHDSQWTALLQSAEGKLEPHELADEHLTVEALNERYVIALEDGVAFLQGEKDTDDPLGDTEGHVKAQSLADTITSLLASDSSRQYQAANSPVMTTNIASSSAARVAPTTELGNDQNCVGTSLQVSSMPIHSEKGLRPEGAVFESSTSKINPGGPTSTMNDVLSWTNQDPRESSLFNNWGVLYRFKTVVSDIGRSTTTLWRAVRANKEDRVAKLEWAPNGGLGRAVIGKNAVPMSDLVRPDPRHSGARTFIAPDGVQYCWLPSTSTSDILLQDPAGNVVAAFRPVRPIRHQVGDVYGELHFFRNAGAGTMVHPPMMDTVTVTAMLYRFCQAFGL